MSQWLDVWKCTAARPSHVRLSLEDDRTVISFSERDDKPCRPLAESLVVNSTFLIGP